MDLKKWAGFLSTIGANWAPVSAAAIVYAFYAGFSASYVFYREFDIPVYIYFEFTDYLKVLLHENKLIFMPLIAAFVMFFSIAFESEEMFDFVKDQRHQMIFLAFSQLGWLFLLFTLIFLPGLDSMGAAKDIKAHPKSQCVITSNETLDDVMVVGNSSKYMFLYDMSEKAPIIIKNSEVIKIQAITNQASGTPKSGAPS